MDCAFVGPQDLPARWPRSELDSPDPLFDDAAGEGDGGSGEERDWGGPDGSIRRRPASVTSRASMISLAAEASILSVAAAQAVKEIMAGR